MSEVVEFDSQAAIHYAQIRAELESIGQPIGPMDLLIAAQARSIDATPVTANFQEFERVRNLKVLRHPNATV